MSFTMYVYNNKLKIITIRFSDIWNQKVDLKFCCDYLNVGTEQFLPNKVSLKIILWYDISVCFLLLLLNTSFFYPKFDVANR